jgi:serine/threonine protein kinase
MAGRHVHTDVAVKMHDHQSFVGYKILLNELCLLRSLRHPNIVNFYGATVDASTGQLCFIIERIVGLSMRDIFSQGNQIGPRWRPDQGCFYAAAAAAALFKGLCSFFKGPYQAL